MLDYGFNNIWWFMMVDPTWILEYVRKNMLARSIIMKHLFLLDSTVIQWWFQGGLVVIIMMIWWDVLVMEGGDSMVLEQISDDSLNRCSIAISGT